jgi:hypothetical protein
MSELQRWSCPCCALRMNASRILFTIQLEVTANWKGAWSLTFSLQSHTILVTRNHVAMGEFLDLPGAGRSVTSV